MRKAPYKTKQAKEILHYFCEHPHNHVQVNEIREYFEEREIKIGVATIYRQLEKLVREGKLLKYIVDRDSGACYELAEKDDHDDNDLHFKCEGCGKLLHVHCHEVEYLNKHIQSDHGFLLNAHRSVFYGLCQECQDHE